MTEKLIVELTILVLAVFVGFEVISKVPSMLHTPLMSATNAIHGIVVVGAMLVAGAAIGGTAGQVIGVAAMILATINVVGGFAVTGRMLQMFKAKSGPKA
jgi:NAD(P) transhydrogenase subunit alpha